VLADPSLHVYSGFLDSPLLGAPDPDVAGDFDDAGELRTDGALGQCQGAPSDQMTVVRGVGEGGAPVWLSLYVYASNRQAELAFASVTADLRACVGFPDADASLFPYGYGDESVAITFLMPRDGAGEMAGAPAHAIAVRVGRAIEVFLATPVVGRTNMVAAPTPDELDTVVRESVPRLCLWAECARAPGLPASLDQPIPGRKAWLVVLSAYDIDDVAARPGHGLIAAALAGYRPVLATGGCDEGANVGPRWRESFTRYLALYFAEQPEAETAAAALRDVAGGVLDPYPQVFEVQTRCSG
jgi:hypothetical protein